MSSSSFKGLTRFFKEKYSCEDKKNAIKYLCSTVWNRDGTILYENPNNEPGTYKGLQLFESPVENKHVDENCNHYTGYALQGLRNDTNEELTVAGGTLFATSIDGYNWSRQSYSASWNEELGHFDCKLTDLDDKSNFTFTLNMNKPKEISWIGYETNAISINPNNLAEGDSGFSAAGYFSALPEDSPKKYPSYETVFEKTGWGGTTKKGLDYVESILRSAPLKVGKEYTLDDKDLLIAGASDYEKKIEIGGLHTILLKANIDGTNYKIDILVKYDLPIALTNSKNRQSGKCVFCFHDGSTNSLKSIKGYYNAIYTANGETSIEIKVGDTVRLTINSSLSNELDYVDVHALKLPVVMYSEMVELIIKVPKTTLKMLNLIESSEVDQDESIETGNPFIMVDGTPFQLSKSFSNEIIGISSFKIPWSNRFYYEKSDQSRDFATRLAPVLLYAGVAAGVGIGSLAAWAAIKPGVEAGVEAFPTVKSFFDSF
jgi:hypothetical protein